MIEYRERIMVNLVTIDELLENEERQTFERKSIMIEPKALAITIVAFANADGGKIVIGISDKKQRIEGIDYEIKRVNELLRVPFDFCEPTVKVNIERVPCVDYRGRENHVIVMYIEPSPQVHANQADEVFLRVGDKSKLLKFEERLQLTYDKGERYFEDKLVLDATIDDLNMEQVKEYIEKIGYPKTPIEFLKQNNGFVVEKNGKLQVSTAAILLFGNEPQKFFPRARVRFIRYEGVEEKFGTEMNVIKDIIFKGTILNMIKESIAYLDTQIKEKTYLGMGGTFVTEEEYPQFVRQEMIVNAVTHRAYSITGTDIQIKMFDNRIVVESPGKLPGMVRADNIRFTHFSRNPKIAEFLKAYGFVKEYGEGVDRMCKELEAVGQKNPEYHTNAFILQTVIFNNESPAIHNENPALQNKNPAIQSESPAIHNENPAFAMKKLEIEGLKSAIEKQKYFAHTEKNLLRVYEAIETNQVFGAPEVKKILDCTITVSKDIMKKLRDIGVVVEVKGKGKGKYRFVYENEKLS
ncbi:MAG: putative DNA binding domain-containing protein [Clostridium sp.]|nr:putative DNA binding domain-containing protein [Clostridium sp.]